MTRRRILIVEDEAPLAAGLKLNLELDAYDVDVAKTGREAGELLLHPQAYSAIILDVNLPDLDGFALCQRLREAGNYTPVIMLTVRNSPADRVTGLEVGADDYLVKPFVLAELLARVKSVLRRREWERSSEPRPSRKLRFGDADVDFDSHVVQVAGNQVMLTQLEIDLLYYFFANSGRVISRDELLERVWKLRHYRDTRTVDNFIVRLRRHFEKDPQAPIHFLSVRGRGYKFVPAPDTSPNTNS